MLLQVVSISKTMLEIIPTIQVPPVLDISRLNLPAQISIDITTGCKKTISSQEITLYKHVSNAFKYLDEVTTKNCPNVVRLTTHILLIFTLADFCDY